jgi:mycothiol system anti-sigma-R factor
VAPTRHLHNKRCPPSSHVRGQGAWNLYGPSRDSSFRASLVPSTRRRLVNPQDVPSARDCPSFHGAPKAPSGACAVVRDSIWDYLDGRCSDRAAARLIAHVPSCAPCARQMAIEEQFLTSLAELRERSMAPAGLRKVVRRTVAVEREIRRHA